MEAFRDWAKAYDYCREINKQVKIKLEFPAENPGIYTFFPSGSFRYEKREEEFMKTS